MSLNGFSLMETMVAIVIVGITSIALIAGIIYSFTSVRLARENLRATQVILEKMEVIRLLTWDQINTTGFIPPLFTASLDPAATNSSGVRFAGSITIDSNVNGLENTNYTNAMRRIRIELSWPSGRTLRTREMSTFVARAGIQNYVFN